MTLCQCEFKKSMRRDATRRDAMYLDASRHVQCELTCSVGQISLTASTSTQCLQGDRQDELLNPKNGNCIFYSQMYILLIIDNIY